MRKTIENNANSTLSANLRPKSTQYYALRKYSQICGIENYRTKVRGIKPIVFNKKGERFEFGLLIVVLTISISLFSFVTEDTITGFVVAGENQEIEISQPFLLEFDNVNSLSTLSAGNYYIDGNGIVYWVDDELTPEIAKVNQLDENQKNQYIYIDKEGRIGYILNPISITENETK